MVLGPADFNGHVEKRIDVFEGDMVDMDLEKEMLREEDCLSFAKKRSWLMSTRPIYGMLLNMVS